MGQLVIDTVGYGNKLTGDIAREAYNKINANFAELYRGGALPVNAAGVLTNDGIGNLSWVAGGGGGGTTTNPLTVDNSSLQLNSGTTFDGSVARTISVKAGGITNAMLANSFAPLNPSTNVVTTNYVAALSDVGKTISYNSASGGNITINDIGSIAWQDGNTLTIRQQSTGAFTVVAGGSTVFINPSGTLVSTVQGAYVQLQNAQGTNTWYVIGGGKTVPTLTDGSVAFYSSSAGNISQNNSALFWDIGNARLGLNNTSPSSFIDVRDNTLTNLTGSSITSGITLSNTGIANVTSFSLEPPAIYFKGNGFQSGTTSVTESFRIRFIPSTADYDLRFSGYVSGSTYTDLFTVKSSGIYDSQGKWRLTFNGAVSSNTFNALTNNTTMALSGQANITGSVPTMRISPSGPMVQTSGTYGIIDHQLNITSSGTTVWYYDTYTGTINTSGNGDIYIAWIKPTITAQGGDFGGILYDPQTPSNITGHNNIIKATSGQFQLPFTLTGAGVTGNQTINKISGSIRIVAGGTSVTLTNSLITANSIVFTVLATVDTTAKTAVSVPGSGSTVFTLNAAATAEVEIRWWVINY